MSKIEAYKTALFYKGDYRPASNEAGAKMVVTINAEDFEDILLALNPDVEEVSIAVPFEDAVRPLMLLLARDYHPHHVAVVTSVRAEISEGVKCFGTNEYIL